MVADDDPDWMPSTTIVDLNLRKRFDFGSRVGLTLSIDGFNIFNEGAANRVGYTGADYGQVTSLTLPRRFRGGIKIDF
jgi:outer membrane receptor protein involved in Fe transport